MKNTCKSMLMAATAMLAFGFSQSALAQVVNMPPPSQSSSGSSQSSTSQAPVTGQLGSALCSSGPCVPMVNPNPIVNTMAAQQAAAQAETLITAAKAEIAKALLETYKEGAQADLTIASSDLAQAKADLAGQPTTVAAVAQADADGAAVQTNYNAAQTSAEEKPPGTIVDGPTGNPGTPSKPSCTCDVSGVCNLLLCDINVPTSCGIECVSESGKGQFECTATMTDKNGNESSTSFPLQVNTPGKGNVGASVCQQVAAGLKGKSPVATCTIDSKPLGVDAVNQTCQLQ